MINQIIKNYLAPELADELESELKIYFSNLSTDQVQDWCNSITGYKKDLRCNNCTYCLIDPLTVSKETTHGYCSCEYCGSFMQLVKLDEDNDCKQRLIKVSL